MDNWKRYQEAGVNIALGSDTYPRDMIMNMRTASYMGKVASNTYFAATAGEVFAAATLGGARSLGRDDIGRLAPGALADIIIIDLSGRGSLRFGPVRDPVKSLIECGVGDDVETVIIDGLTPTWVTVMRYSSYAWRDVPDGWLQRDYLPRFRPE